MPWVPAHWGSGPRLFNEEASDIGSNLIAMALLQQQNRVVRSAEKKQARIIGRISSLSGVVATYSSRVLSHASFSDKIAVVACFEPRSPAGGLLTLSLDGLPSLLSNLHVFDKDIVHETVSSSIKNSRSVIMMT